MEDVTRRRTRIAVGVGSILTAVTLVGIALYLSRQGLDRADKIASVLGVLLNTTALAIAIAGVLLSWWLGRTPPARRIRQRIEADGMGTIVARRAQRAHGGSDVEQEISGRGAGRIDASDAQSVGPDDA